MRRLQRALCALTITAACLIPIVALLIAFPTSHFVRPISLSYDAGTMRWELVREVARFGSVTQTFPDGGQRRGIAARWRTELAMVDPQDLLPECSTPGWQHAFYQSETRQVSYVLDAWATPCLRVQRPFYVVTQRQAFLWGWLPLLPSESIARIDPANPDAVAITVE